MRIERILCFHSTKLPHFGARLRLVVQLGVMQSFSIHLHEINADRDIQFKYLIILLTDKTSGTCSKSSFIKECDAIKIVLSRFAQDLKTSVYHICRLHALFPLFMILIEMINIAHIIRKRACQLKCNQACFTVLTLSFLKIEFFQKSLATIYMTLI